MFLKKEMVLPGFEPGSQESESCVLTNYTIRPPISCSEDLF